MNLPAFSDPAAFSDANGGYTDPDRDWINAAQGIRARPAEREESTCKPLHHGKDSHSMHGWLADSTGGAPGDPSGDSAACG